MLFEKDNESFPITPPTSLPNDQQEIRIQGAPQKAAVNTNVLVTDHTNKDSKQYKKVLPPTSLPNDEQEVCTQEAPQKAAVNTNVVHIADHTKDSKQYHQQETGTELTASSKTILVETNTKDGKQLCPERCENFRKLWANKYKGNPDYWADKTNDDKEKFDKQIYGNIYLGRESTVERFCILARQSKSEWHNMMKNIHNSFRKYDETEMQMHLDNLDNDLQSMNQECDAKKKEETSILLRTASKFMLLPEDLTKRCQFEFEDRFVLEKKGNKEDRIGKVKNRSDIKKAANMKKRREMQMQSVQR